MVDDKSLKKELTKSFDRKHSLVLIIPKLDKWTHLNFRDMEDYVKSKKKYAWSYEELQKHSGRNAIPSLLNETMRDQVLDKIHELVRHAERSQQLEKKTDYFVTISSEWMHEGYGYAVYNAGKLVKEKLDHLPSPPEKFWIVESGQDRAKGSSSISLLQWKFENLGFPCHFIVQYRLKGTSDKCWEEKRTMKPGEMEMYIRVTNGSVVEFGMATETGVGLSEFSDIVEHEFGMDNGDDIEEDFVSARKRKRPCALPTLQFTLIDILKHLFFLLSSYYLICEFFPVQLFLKMPSLFSFILLTHCFHFHKIPP